MHHQKRPDGARDRGPIAKWNVKERQGRVGACQHHDVDRDGGSTDLQNEAHQITPPP